MLLLRSLQILKADDVVAHETEFIILKEEIWNLQDTAEESSGSLTGLWPVGLVGLYSAQLDHQWRTSAVDQRGRPGGRDFKPVDFREGDRWK